MKPINIPLEHFVSCFFEANETVCLRVFDDKKTGTFKGAKLRCEAGKIGSMAETLRKHNAQDRGIFFVVNYGGDGDAEITRINAVFVENDSLSIEEQIKRLEAFALPPSLMAQTARSVHAYWLVKDVEVRDFRRLQKKLISQFDGDVSCINESRVLRLPGFNHCKEEPVEVKCIKFAPELRYTMAQLEAALPQIPEAEHSGEVFRDIVGSDSGNGSGALPAPKGSRKGLISVGKRCDFIQHCKDNAQTLSEHDWYGMITNLAVFEGGDRVIHTLSKGYPKYTHKETEDKIAHFLESGTKPMTCAKIAECGFKCPKLEQGGCECKSPAALCYKPLTTDELLISLNSFEIPDLAIEKIKTIKEFIQDYMYNIEPVIAGTVISHNVRERFGLKAGDMGPLLKLHRDIYKKYADSKETRRETNGADLPNWYEPTERGGLKFLPCVLADHMANSIAAFLWRG